MASLYRVRKRSALIGSIWVSTNVAERRILRLSLGGETTYLLLPVGKPSWFT